MSIYIFCLKCKKREEQNGGSEAVDVAPVRRGRWVKMDMHKGMEQYKCSVCNQECFVPTCMGEPLYNYCPNCGAKMEEVSE